MADSTSTKKGLELVKFISEFDNAPAFIQDLENENTFEISVDELTFASFTDKKEVRSNGFELAIRLILGSEKTEYPFTLQLTKSKNVTDSTKSAFSTHLAIPRQFKIAEIPIVNLPLEEPQTFELVRFSYVSASEEAKETKIGRYQVKELETGKDENGFTTIKVKSFKAKPLDSGFSFELKGTGPIEFHLGGDKKKDDKSENETASGSTDTTPSDTETKDAKLPVEEDGIKWFDLKKKLGPLYIGRIGLSYEKDENNIDDKGRINVCLDASLNIKVLSLSVIGLKIGTTAKLKEMFDTPPTIDLDGLSVVVKTKAVEIGGMLLRMQLAEGRTEFVGQIFIKVPIFNLIGTGIYGKIGDKTSMFFYAFLGASLGGPPFFFIKGLALGFGYNRACVVPFDEVGKFPLTKQALDMEFADDVTKVRQLANDLVKYLPAKEGSIIIMVGIKFSTFEIIEGFLLLVLEISENPKIELLGLARLYIGEGDVHIVKIELGLKASITPLEGIVEIVGVISEGSYIFEENCKVYGGFAFKAWALGEHAGDFVLTLGGYHPEYKKPAHYPDVPRIGISWEVEDILAIKAEAYFALTPNTIMAGGYMEMYLAFGPIFAEFSAGLDFFISWKPFYYHIRIFATMKIGFSPGAKRSIQERTSAKFYLELGASLKLWGPELSGEAAIRIEIDLFLFSIGLTVNVSFGDAVEYISPLNWLEFADEFIPLPITENVEQANKNQSLENLFKNDIEILPVNIEKGLIKEDEKDINGNKQRIWIVEKKEVVFTVETPIPITEYKNESSDVLADWIGMKERNRRLIIPLMGNKSITSTMSITITKIKGSATSEQFEIKTPIYKNLPSALWRRTTKAEGETTKNLVAGFKIGYALPPIPTGTSEVPAKNLEFSDFKNTRHIEAKDSDCFDFDVFAELTNCSKKLTKLDRLNMISYHEFITMPKEDDGRNTVTYSIADDFKLV